jgi:uncharacterized coiled-coil DUF342 family protein
MAESLGDRLEQLEKSVRRATDLIASLKSERDALLGRVASLETERAEVQRLRQERGEVLAQVENILRELDKLL